MWPTFFWTHNLNNSMCHQFLHSLLSTAEKRVSPFSQSAFSSRCRFRNRIYLLCLEDGHGHALISPEASNHLSDDIGRFSEILTPADAGACQEVLDETYSDVVTPMKARRGVGGRKRTSNWYFPVTHGWFKHLAGDFPPVPDVLADWTMLTNWSEARKQRTGTPVICLELPHSMCALCLSGIFAFKTSGKQGSIVAYCFDRKIVNSSRTTQTYTFVLFMYKSTNKARTQYKEQNYWC